MKIRNKQVVQILFKSCQNVGNFKTLLWLLCFFRSYAIYFTWLFAFSQLWFFFVQSSTRISSKHKEVGRTGCAGLTSASRARTSASAWAWVLREQNWEPPPAPSPPFTRRFALHECTTDWRNISSVFFYSVNTKLVSLRFLTQGYFLHLVIDSTL